MDKRAIFGIALSILILVIYQDLVSRFYPPVPTTPAPTVESPKDSKPSGADAAKESSPAVAPAQAAPAEIPARQPAREIRVETENYNAVFTTRGARLKSFKFKKYRTSADENSPPFEMVLAAPWVE